MPLPCPIPCLYFASPRAHSVLRPLLARLARTSSSHASAVASPCLRCMAPVPLQAFVALRPLPPFAVSLACRPCCIHDWLCFVFAGVPAPYIWGLLARQSAGVHAVLAPVTWWVHIVVPRVACGSCRSCPNTILVPFADLRSLAAALVLGRSVYRSPCFCSRCPFPPLGLMGAEGAGLRRPNVGVLGALVASSSVWLVARLPVFRDARAVCLSCAVFRPAVHFLSAHFIFLLTSSRIDPSLATLRSFPSSARCLPPFDSVAAYIAPFRPLATPLLDHGLSDYPCITLHSPLGWRWSRLFFPLVWPALAGVFSTCGPVLHFLRSPLSLWLLLVFFPSSTVW